MGLFRFRSLMNLESIPIPTLVLGYESRAPTILRHEEIVPGGPGEQLEFPGPLYNWPGPYGPLTIYRP